MAERERIPRGDESRVSPSGSETAARDAERPSSGVPVETEATDAGSVAPVPELNHLTRGVVVDGKYEIEDIIGRGAMGVVVAARHVHLGERVALKFMSIRQHGAGEDFTARFKREARVSAKLRNEHIARVLDVAFWRDDTMYMVMEYLEGVEVATLLRNQATLPVDVAIGYIVQVCEGLAEAHARGIVHRDLKPSNLFVTKRPDGSPLIKILDFGISKWSTPEGGGNGDGLTATGIVLGTPKYMAPEQLFGASEVDARADVWSVGAILYAMLAGRPPYNENTFVKLCAALATNTRPPRLKELRPDLSDEIEEAVMGCLARAPVERTQNVAVVAGKLLAALGSPHALAVRERIQAMLDVGGPNASGALPALSPDAAAALTGTGSSVTPHIARPSMTAGGVASPSAPPAEPPARRNGLALVAAAVLIVGVVFILARRGGGPEPSKPLAPVAAAAVPASNVNDAAAAPVRPLASAANHTAAAAGEPGPSVPIGAASVASPVSATAPPRAPSGEPARRHASPRSATAPQPATPPPTAPVTPPAPAAVVRPPAQPKPPSNPLEERQ